MRQVYLNALRVLGFVFAMLCTTPAQATDCWKLLSINGALQRDPTAAEFQNRCWNNASEIIGAMAPLRAASTYIEDGDWITWQEGFHLVSLTGAEYRCMQPPPGQYYALCAWAWTWNRINKINGEASSGAGGGDLGTDGTFVAGLAAHCPGNAPIDPRTTQCQPHVIRYISGGSTTKALPAGPHLPQGVEVKDAGGTALKNAAVTITTASGASFSGNANEAGQFFFNYVPPRKAMADKVSAICSGCVIPAEKTIDVSVCDICEAQARKGNPINTATGEKEQDELDWQDSGPHPLTFSRHYRSFGNLASGFHGRWSHNFAASVSQGPAEATVRLGEGSTVFFRRAGVGAPWVADNGRDSLLDAGGALTYVRGSDDSRWKFDAGGKLTSITERNGWLMSLTYNGSRLMSVTNAFGRSLQFAWGADGRIASVTPPDGRPIQYSYSRGGIEAVLYPGGAYPVYYYESNSVQQELLTYIYAGDERGKLLARFAYDNADRAVSTEHAGTRRYVVNYGTSDTSQGAGAAITTQAVDPAAWRTTVNVTDPQGNTQGYTWQGGDGSMRLVSSGGNQDGNQLATRTLLAGTNLAESETDHLGVVTRYTWDVARRLKLSTTRAAGRPEAQTTATQWHPTLRLPALITEPGRTSAFSYDAVGNKTGETITDTATGQVRSQAWTYNAQGLLDTMTDAKGGLWRYGYDAAGNRTSVKNPLGQEATATYDTAGRLLTQREPNGLVNTYTYDPRGRVLTHDRGGETSRYTYTNWGLLTSATLPNGYRVDYGYDEANRLIAANDNRGARIAYTLDAAGNRIREEVKDAGGAIALVTSRVINSLNQLAAVQGAAGQSTQLAYDANGEAISATDPLNQTTRQTLDGLRRPTATTFPDNSAASQAWNPLDQLAQLTDPKGVATTYTNNAFGEVTGESSPDIGNVAYTRDAAGDITGQSDAKGNATAITRDALGRPTEIRHAADHVSHFSYDSNQAGYLAKVEDKSGATAYERDAQGRITSKTQDVNDTLSTPSRFKVSYAFAAGDLSAITYPSGLVVSYPRTAGRISGINVQVPGKNKPTVPFVTGLTHTALGQPKSWSWSNGDSASRNFDADGRMTGNEFASYIYDAASRITGITQNLWASSTATGTVTLYTTPMQWAAGYDSRNRLTSFTRDGAQTSYTYDANSNRLTAIDKVTADTDLDGVFDNTDFATFTRQQLNIEAASNKLLGFVQTVTTTNNNKTRSVVTTPVNYSLDANGAMTSDGLRGFEYDASNRLSRVSIFKDGEAAQVRYLTNALGQRVFKGEPTAEQTLPNETTLGTSFVDWLKKQFGWMFLQAAANTSIGTAYIYGDNEIPSWAILGEYDNGSAKGAGRTEYIWLPTEDGNAIPVGIFRNGKFFAIHTDHLGTPRLMTNDVNKPVWQWPYSAFGNNKPTGVLIATPNPKAAITNIPVLLKATNATVLDLRFPGQIDDAETGTFYNYFRNYNAGQGRYMQADPIGLAGGNNRSIYGTANPFGRIDSMGLWASKWGFPVHQLVGGYVFGQQLSREENLLVDRGQNWADSAPNQAALMSFMHGMSNKDVSQSPSAACAQASQYLKKIAALALQEKALGNRKKSLFLFGVALHTMQDSTSPSHRGFQSWSDNRNWFETVWHGARELFMPMYGSPLWTITQRAWDGFSNNDINAFSIDCTCTN